MVMPGGGLENDPRHYLDLDAEPPKSKKKKKKHKKKGKQEMIPDWPPEESEKREGMEEETTAILTNTELDDLERLFNSVDKERRAQFEMIEYMDRMMKLINARAGKELISKDAKEGEGKAKFKLHFKRDYKGVLDISFDHSHTVIIKSDSEMSQKVLISTLSNIGETIISDKEGNSTCVAGEVSAFNPYYSSGPYGYITCIEVPVMKVQPYLEKVLGHLVHLNQVERPTTSRKVKSPSV